MRNFRIFVAAVLTASGSAALALGSPHNGSYASAVTTCESCHQLHGTTSTGTLLKSTYSTNDSSCLTCHNLVGSTDSNSPFFNGWDATTQAAAGAAGIHHSWSATATNLGAVAPTNPDMSSRLIAGKLQCAVCHDPHAPNAAFVTGTSMRSSFPVGTPQNKTSGTGSGQLTVSSISATAGNATPAGYAIKIGSTATTFQISHNFYAATPTWSANLPFTAGTAVALDDSHVTVTISAGTVVGDYWLFYVSAPFIREDNTTGGMCMDCHKNRNQTYQNVEGTGPLAGTGGAITLGITVFSHPVAQPLNINGNNYDRATILAPDGTNQPYAANPTANLNTGAGGVVTCLTCHAPHNADSNSLTVDPQ